MTSPKKNNQAEDSEPTERRITMRDIAREAGVSHVAVSKALRGLNGVSEQTRTRILEKAEEMGYVPDPLLSVLSHYRLSSKTKPLQAELAWINLWKHPEEVQKFKEFNLYREGAVAGAKRLGFHLQEFNAADLPMKRLDNILKTRCIQGILLPPVYDHLADWSSFPWSDYATVLLGRSHPYPESHFVSSAQTANTMLAFKKAKERGYRRIGFVCEFRDERYFGAGFIWAQKNCPAEQQVPLLSLDPAHSPEKQQEMFGKWLKQHKPDAILTDHGGTLQMLENLNYRIPDDIGLATTSIHDIAIDAGIDQKPFEIGRAAIRNLVALLVEKSFGIPETRNEILIEGQWVDGSMLPHKSQP